MGLLEVVPDDLVALDEVVRREPVGEALVQLRSRRLGQRLVGGIADEQMPEPESFVLRETSGAVERMSSLRTSVARCDSTLEPDRIRRELRDCAAVEDLALDCAPLHHDAHVAVERVDACLQERMDRRRDSDLAVAAVLAHHREHLLDEERISRRRGRDSVP